MLWTTYVSPSDGRQHPAVLADGSLHGLRTATRLIDLLGDDGELLARAGERALADPLDVPGGTFTVTITGVSGSLARSTTVMLSVMRGAVAFEAAHRSQPCLEPPVVALYAVVRVPLHVVECSWH